MEVTQPGGTGGSSSSLTVTDGITPVVNVSTLNFSNGLIVTNAGGGQANAAIENNLILDRVQFSIDGGGVAVTTGQKGTYPVTFFAGTITAWNITVDTGTCTVKFWKRATGTAIPTIANVINTSGVSISSGTVVRSTTLSDFTTVAVAANDIWAMDVTAVSGATKIWVGLEITKT